jgi:hypothetical protein
MDYIEFNISSNNILKAIPIRSIESGDWSVKWSGLIECVDTDDRSVHGGMYIYTSELIQDAERILALNKEQLKIDIKIQAVQDFFKVQVYVQDLKTLDSVFFGFLTTKRSIDKFTKIVRDTNTTWVFIRTGSSIFHSRIDMHDSEIYHLSYSSLQ